MRASKKADDPAPIYREVERILARDMAIIPIYHYANTFLLAADIAGGPTTTWRTTGIRRTSIASRTERGGGVHGYAGARFGASPGRDVRVRAGSPPNAAAAFGA